MKNQIGKGTGSMKIQFDNVSKKLGKFRLHNISFEVPPGYICGLVGRNGAGKTTLLHLLLGLYRADEGHIFLDDLCYEKDEESIHDMIGTVLVEELFDPVYSIRVNADRFGRFYTKYSRERMGECLEKFGLNPHRRFGRLSKGEKLKCQFAFALSCEPGLLVLDEPAGNFDPDFREQFFKIIQEFIADGTRSVILATHLTEDLDRLADYLIYLEEGGQVFAGDIEHFRSAYRMASGERYKIDLLPKEMILHIEDKKYGAKALVRHSRSDCYGDALDITYPSIEEFMYFYSKRGTAPAHCLNRETGERY